MAIDFSKFKSNKSEASVKTESHSQKSVTNSKKMTPYRVLMK